LLCPLWAYFRLPETKGRTFRELDVLFENRVPAKQFASTAVDSGIGADAREQLAFAGDL
jgi:SP family general alpha glucoside:H+ symporter-like MFS transporter